jgi:hypothetical protein
MSIAYGLRAEFAGTVTQVLPADDQHDDPREVDVPAFTGGVISYDDGQSFDIRAALDEDPHPGVIVVSEANTGLVLALDEYPALRRVTVPTDLADAPTSGYDDLTVTQLRAEADRRGLEGAARARKDILVKALTDHDRRLAAGDADAQAAPDHVVRILDDGDLETPADRAGEPGVNADTAGASGQED